MHNYSLDHLARVFANKPADVQGAKDTNKKTIHTKVSVIRTTLVVKEHGESLLIKLPEAASTLAARGDSVSPAITCLFPLPYRSLKKVMQASFFDMSSMSAS
jgi:hypothetical protein